MNATAWWTWLKRHLPWRRRSLGDRGEAAAARFLKRLGYRIVARQARLTGYDWFHLDLPRHYWHFDSQWLNAALKARGLTIAEIGFASLEQNPFGWIQSLLNRTGLRHNLLYDLLRSRSARAVKQPWREHPWQAAASLAGLACLLPTACALLLPEALFRCGGTIELFAVKR